MTAHQALLALGSNIEPEANLPAAVRFLERWGQVLAASRVWQSAAVGMVEQPDFLNAAVLLHTPLAAEEIIGEMIPAIEGALGRVRDPHNKNAPRTIDVDLVFYDDFRGEVLGRTIPDPEIHARPFLAVPLAEAAADFLHPLTGESLQQIAAQFGELKEQLIERADVKLLAARMQSR